MFKFDAARILRLSLACLVVSVIAGSPLASLGLVLAQAIVPPVGAALTGCLLLALFLLKGRDATVVVTLASSRTFILGMWLLVLTLLWFVTILATPQAYGTVTAASNVALALGTLGYRQWRAGSFWPSRTNGRFDAYVAKLKAEFAEFERRTA